MAFDRSLATTRGSCKAVVDKDARSWNIVRSAFPGNEYDHVGLTFVDPRETILAGTKRVRPISDLMSPRMLKNVQEPERHDVVNAVNYIVNKRRDKVEKAEAGPEPFGGMKCDEPRYGGKQETPWITWDVDESFVPVIKLIRKKGFCTYDSCSALARDHHPDRIGVMKQDALNGRISVKLVEIDTGAMPVLTSWIERTGRASVLRFEMLDEVLCVPERVSTMNARIVSSAADNGFSLEYYLQRKLKSIIVSIEPAETKAGIGLGDAEILERWNKFARGL